MRAPIVAMITDFGDRDGFTGVMKGGMLSVYPHVSLVDVAHHVPPQDVWHGSWVLDQAFDAFPAGTMFLCVVDPEVGSPVQRKLALYSPTLRKGLVLPDNGLATRLLRRIPDFSAVAIENTRYFRNVEPPSATFHGRDIYAPVAAHLARAYAEGSVEALLSTLGLEVAPDALRMLAIQPPRRVTAEVLEGQIDVVDTYGNLMTNIPACWMPEVGMQVCLTAGGQELSLLYASHYQALRVDSPHEHTIGLVAGSHGMLEILAPNRSAHRLLNLAPGELIRLHLTLPETCLQIKNI